MTNKEYAVQESFDYGSAHWLLQKRIARDRQVLANLERFEHEQAFGCVSCRISNPRHCAESGHSDCSAFELGGRDD